MKDVLGIINVTQENPNLQALGSHRCQASIPYAGRYRIIDFILSNMVQANIRNIAVFAPPNYRSLLDHLGSGKDWDLEYKQDGLFIFPQNALANNNQGDISILNQHLDYLEKSNQTYVLLSFGSLIMNIDFKGLIKHHIHSGSDITVLYKQKENDDLSLSNILLDDFQNISSFKASGSPHGSLDIFVLRKDLLIQLIKKHAHQSVNLLEILMESADKYSMNAFKFDGYVQKIDSVASYYQSNMQLLESCFLAHALFSPNEIYSKLKDEPPTKYGETSKVKNVIIANGCVIEGEVENSILFRGTRVEKGAVIKNSIVFPKSVIGEYAQLDGVIVDKELAILPFERLSGTMTSPKVVTKHKIIGREIG
ncbi:glucose-1-phosphate adenylyltransferase [Paraliobacillus quinghaiensis]|uniref:Glucose-1-phosphate adenylyltransferase n=1 Tax=Paraliobacillus quinghaiensis TaxID=470815 RepID=A0A917TVP7_9BACI|nr:glucose-1-phosphate adenylyltransferase subunit GlgD [Paraliobacillus quinghaiensis]GGM39957.1 glucose-1-phosphate adenylyltransferase [Paraliobacillus quinghaiensis]